MNIAAAWQEGARMPDEANRRLEGKIDALFALMTEIKRKLEAGEKPAARANVLPRMTTKQHATLQMLLRGASNAEIAERFGVTVNTAKVHVRSLFPKVGGSTRTKIVLALKPAFDATPADEYVIHSGGLPKDWDATYASPDPYAPLYQGHDHGTETDEAEGR
jgi:DNA-binding CsgD family transcriptional regulator